MVKKYYPLALSAETHFKVKIIASLYGKTMAQLIDELINRRWEKEQDAIVALRIEPRIGKQAKNLVRKIKGFV